MPIRKPFIWRGLVDLSWSKFNLFNLHEYASAMPERQLQKTTFQLRWRAKQLCHAYHLSHIAQKKFRRLRMNQLPRLAGAPATEKSLSLPTPPATMLGFGFLERRVDMAIFRACFVPSIWAARKLCRFGCVTVNGSKVTQPGYIMEDGDIIQVQADRLELLNPSHKQKEDWEDWAAEANNGKFGVTEGEDSEDDDQDDILEAAKDLPTSDGGEEKKIAKVTSMAYPKENLEFHPLPYMAAWMFVPEYLEVNYNNLTICLLRSPLVKPGRCEIPTPYDELIHQRAFDFYTQYRKF